MARTSCDDTGTDAVTPRPRLNVAGFFIAFALLAAHALDILPS